MTIQSIYQIFIGVAVLLTAACTTIRAESLTQEEASVVAKIESWPGKWRSGKDGLAPYASSIIEDLKNLPNHSRRILYLNRLIDVVLSSSFEDCPPFPLEDWERRPVIMNANDEDPRKTLRSMHLAIVDTVEVIYCEQRRLYRPMEDRLSLILRFEQKMEKERKRLGAIDVGGASLLVDQFEKELGNYLAKGEQTEERLRIRSRFEKTMGRPIRDLLKIEEEQQQRLRLHRETVKKNMEAYKRSYYGLPPN